MAHHKGSAANGHSATGSALELQQRRKRAGVSLEEIADRTKISIRFLRAIEQEDFEKLPGGIFATSYLRQYAAAVGLEERVLLDRYSSRREYTAVSEPVREAPSNPLVRMLRASFTTVR